MSDANYNDVLDNYQRIYDEYLDIIANNTGDSQRDTSSYVAELDAHADRLIEINAEMMNNNMSEYGKRHTTDDDLEKKRRFIHNNAKLLSEEKYRLHKMAPKLSNLNNIKVETDISVRSQHVQYMILIGVTSILVIGIMRSI